MATLTILLKEGGGRVEIDTSIEAATRVYNRYIVYLRDGGQASQKFNLDGPEAGMLALSFANVAALLVTER